jgi:hypothetical protein
MPPIFKNFDLTRDHLSDHMREFAEKNDHLTRPQRSLIGSMKGCKILLFTDLLKWYLEHGLVVTHIYQIVEYEPSQIFFPFGESVTAARRAGDIDSSQKLLADTAKLIGNSLYGKTITDKTKHRNVFYTCEERVASAKIRSHLFQSINPLDNGVYETTSFKKTVSFFFIIITIIDDFDTYIKICNITLYFQINMDVPVQIGFAILQRAKRRMLEYHYDCLDR